MAGFSVLKNRENGVSFFKQEISAVLRNCVTLGREIRSPQKETAKTLMGISNENDWPVSGTASHFALKSDAGRQYPREPRLALRSEKILGFPELRHTFMTSTMILPGLMSAIA